MAGVRPLCSTATPVARSGYGEGKLPDRCHSVCMYRSDRTVVHHARHRDRSRRRDANKVMIDRLEKILNGQLKATDIDKRFYTHEIRELERYRNLSVKDGTLPPNEAEVWNNTHTATLEDYKLGNSETLLYISDALKAAEEQELRELE